MGAEISYKGSVIKTLTEGSTTLLTNGKRLSGDIVVALTGSEPSETIIKGVTVTVDSDGSGVYLLGVGEELHDCLSGTYNNISIVYFDGEQYINVDCDDFEGYCLNYDDMSFSKKTITAGDYTSTQIIIPCENVLIRSSQLI